MRPGKHLIGVVSGAGWPRFKAVRPPLHRSVHEHGGPHGQLGMRQGRGTLLSVQHAFLLHVLCADVLAGLAQVVCLGL